MKRIFLLFYLPLVLFGEPDAISISYPYQATFSDELTVQVYAYNHSGQASAFEGDFTDAEGNLILTGPWTCFLEQMHEGRVVQTIPLKGNPKRAAQTHVVKASEYGNWSWKFRPETLVGEPGVYRFRAVCGKHTSTGNLIRFAETLDLPEGVSLRYAPEKKEYFLGEPIQVIYRVQNKSSDPFIFETGGDYRGSTRHLRYYFTAERDDGLKVEDPRPTQMCMGGIGGPRLVEPGKTQEEVIRLNPYLLFTKPGTYTVMGYQDQGFGEKVFKSSAGTEYAAGSSFILKLREPGPEDLRKLLNRLAGIKDNYERERAFRELSYPGLLDTLLRAVEFENSPTRQQAFIAGIGSILNVESTHALVRLLDDVRVAVREAALDKLVIRVKPAPVPGQDPAGHPPWNQAEISSAWDESLRDDLYKRFKAHLQSESLAEVLGAARGLAAIGNPEALPLLAEAGDRIMPDIKTTTDLERHESQHLANAAYLLGRYGPVHFDVDKQSSLGRLVVWAGAVSWFPDQWKDQRADLILYMLDRSDCPVVQHAGIRLVDDHFEARDRVPWRKLLGSKDHSVWWYAEQALKVDPPDHAVELLRHSAKGVEPAQAKSLLRTADELRGRE